MPLNIQKLIQEPFGPYPDCLILRAQPKKATVLNVASVYMECAGSCIGLDECEFLSRAPENSRVAQHPVYFFGKLVVESLDWLSDQGKEWLERDLRRVDHEVNHGVVSGLTLSRLYGDVRNEGSRITVWIRGEKNMQALFLIDTHPESLIFHSRTRESPKYGSRTYNITSLDVLTFEKSRNFLSRYQLWALIDEIIKTDKDGTPRQDRTIDWLVDVYLQRFRKHDTFRRHIFDFRKDTDVDKHGKTKRPRYLRHIPRAEIFGIFAGQSEWLLAQQLASASHSLRKLNISSWIAFCQQVKYSRMKATVNGSHWGLPHGIGSSSDSSDIDLSQFGGTQAFWAKKMRSALKQQGRTNRKRVDQPPKNEVPRQERIATFIYDSDFSEASTPPASGSDSDSSPLPTLGLTVPTYCWGAPSLPPGQFEWRCDGCNYTIDMLNPNDANMDGLPVGIVAKLREKALGSPDEIQQVLCEMVSKHYHTVHLKERGMRLKWTGRKWCVEAIQRKVKSRPTKVVVKKEINDD